MARAPNREIRRAALIEVAADVIAKCGMDGLTVRVVARAARVSTGVVSHHFVDKRELLQATYDALAIEVHDRVARLMQKEQDALTCLEGLLPLDAERLRDWRVWLAFWGLAVGDAPFAKDQKDRARRARKLVEKILVNDPRFKASARRIDSDVASRMVLGVIQGIAAQTVFSVSDWPATRQSRVLEESLRVLYAK